MPATQNIDLLISSRWVVPVVPNDQVLEGCAIAVDKGQILAILPVPEAEKRYQARERVDLPNHILIPGLINAHGHAGMSLLRGYADDKPLHTWLEDHIWPAEARWVSRDFVRDGCQLAMAEMLRGGTTCFADMYFFPDQVAQAAQQAGMRAQVTAPVLDFPTVWGRNPDEYISKALAVHDDFRSSDLITVGFGPHAPYTVSDGPLQRLAVLAEELQAPVQIHLHETAFEVEQALQNSGRRPTERLQDLGLLTPLTQCVHMTQVAPVDVELLLQTGAHVVHCPESNLKLASGFCPVNDLLEAGVNVALGTDGAASNNDLDLMGEMCTAALLAKGVSGNAAALNAHEALRMATLYGARAMNQEQHIGSLEAGKAADITAVCVDSLEASPIFDPVSHLVYTNCSRDVSHVWVKGKELLQERRLLTLNEMEIRGKAREWQELMSRRPAS
ncbi:TRZ/ATZ family hydrolase [Gilvimarinus sp. F26214L]|uniref:TRZ/ATZ family hydrolase n=1 Tax=Gilvimarinus sp. DZF01 TaxID=3461371 RepID=UPI0040455578